MLETSRPQCVFMFAPVGAGVTGHVCLKDRQDGVIHLRALACPVVHDVTANDNKIVKGGGITAGG